jgi:hypothetical protein
MGLLRSVTVVAPLKVVINEYVTGNILSTVRLNNPMSKHRENKGESGSIQSESAVFLK